jgi:hypothetical protein
MLKFRYFAFYINIPLRKSQFTAKHNMAGPPAFKAHMNSSPVEPFSSENRAVDVDWASALGRVGKDLRHAALELID